MEKQKKSDDLGLKLGSEEMIYWKKLIDAKKEDVKRTKENLKFFEFIVENAEKMYKKAEEEFNKK